MLASLQDRNIIGDFDWEKAAYMTTYDIASKHVQILNRVVPTVEVMIDPRQYLSILTKHSSISIRLDLLLEKLWHVSKAFHCSLNNQYLWTALQTPRAGACIRLDWCYKASLLLTGRCVTHMMVLAAIRLLIKFVKILEIARLANSVAVTKRCMGSTYSASIIEPQLL